MNKAFQNWGNVYIFQISQEQSHRQVLHHIIFFSLSNKGLALRRAWQPTPVFLPGEFHGQRSLGGYSFQGHKESDMTEASYRTHILIIIVRVTHS